MVSLSLSLAPALLHPLDLLPSDLIPITRVKTRLYVKIK